MATKKAKCGRKKTTYTYQFLDGQSCELKAGQDGVTTELLEFLRGNDKEMKNREDEQASNQSYFFINCVKRYEKQPDDCSENPINLFSDKHADIFAILFPDTQEDTPELAKLKHAMEMLTEEQRDLIWESYGQLKGDSEIASERNVSHSAIYNRRQKILKQIKKILAEA